MNTAALALIKSEIDQMDNAGEMGQILAAAGSFVLGRLGFITDAPAEIKISIGDDDPDSVSILIAWPIPAAVR
jgi:hypothetical protein